MELSKLESFIIEKVSKTRIPGLSIALLKEGEIIYSRGFGFRDVENGLPSTKNTIYAIGSVTKSFTALAIMQLAEKGKLSLEDPVLKYVPSLNLREEIKIKHLLTHSSGIPALAYAEAYIRGLIGESQSWLPLASYEDLFSFMRDSEEWREAKPGEKFFYLNEGYVILGYIIEKLSGMGYEEYVRRNILEPLKMRRTFFRKEELEKEEDKATPYIITSKGEIVRSSYPFGLKADGGLLSNVIDLLNYAMLYINRGVFEDMRLISEESILEMEKERIKRPLGIFDEEYYGYGWVIVPDFLGKRLIWHSGSVLVSTAFLGYIPSERIAVAILANGSGYPLSFLGMYALALALNKDPEKELSFIAYDRLLDKLMGSYETYKGTYRAELTRKGDFLYLEFKGKYSEVSLPLVYEGRENGKVYFYTISAGRKMGIEFKERNGKIEMIYERYKMRKIS